MAENIKSRKYYRVHNGTDWDRMHFVTDANSVDANDGDTMETKVGAIKGITTSTSVTEEGYAADAKTVSELNSSLDKVRTYVGTDGKIHFVNSAGADTVLNFNKGTSQGTVSVTVSGSASTYKSYVTAAASVSGTTNFIINFDTKTVTVSSGGYTLGVSATSQSDNDGRSTSAALSKSAKII